MLNFKSLVLMTLFTFSVIPAFADSPQVYRATMKTKLDQCPINMDLNDEERLALRLFNYGLQGMMKSYGKPDFQAHLNSILEQRFPDKKVIEVSPVFYERVIYLVDQQQLWNDIEQTIGKNHPLWWRDFKPFMQTVTEYNYSLQGWQKDKFDKVSQDLVKLISGLKPSELKKKGLTNEDAELLKARTLVRLNDAVMYITRWDIINGEISRVKMNDNLKTFGLIALGFLPGGVILTTTFRAKAIIGITTRFAASFASDPVTAAFLSKTSQILTGGAFGVAGATAIQMDIDIYNTLASASRNSKNNDTLYACELERQIKGFRDRGVTPYLKAAALGGSIGLGGGALTLSALGAKTLMYATRFGVQVAFLYSAKEFGSNYLSGLEKLAQAQDEMERTGDRAAAAKLLQSYRADRQNAYEALLEAMFIGILAKEISHEFKTALFEGGDAIRILFASSSDTMGTAFFSAKDAVCSMAGKSAYCE